MGEGENEFIILFRRVLYLFLASFLADGLLEHKRWGA